MEPQGFPQPYKQPNLPPSLRFPRRTEIDWIDLPLRYRTAPAYASNGGTGTIAASTTGTGTFGSNLTAGNCLAISVETAAGVALSSVTDTLGHLWTIVTNANNVSGGRLTMAYCNNCRAGACTVTVTIASSGTASFAFAEYSGVGSIAHNRTLADANATATGNSTAPQASATPQQSGSLLVVGAGSIVGGSTYTGSNSCTTRQTSSGTYDAAIGDKVLSTTSIAAATGGFTITSAQWSCVALVLRPAGQQVTSRRISVAIASSTTLTTAAYTVQLGSVVIALVQSATTGTTTTSVSDTASETWSLIAGSRAVNPSGGELSVWICNGTVSTASRTFSAVMSSATAGSITIMELSGLIPCSGIVDQVATSTGNGTAISVTAGGATAIANELAILCIGAPNTSGNITPGGSDVVHADINTASGSTAVTGRLLNAASTPTLTATLGTTRQYSATLITLKTGGLSLGQTAAPVIASVTAPFNVPPGEMVVLSVGLSANTPPTISGVTDTQGNTWVRADGATVGSGGTAWTQELWYTISAAGGKLTATATTAAASPFWAIELATYSGISAVDVTANATNTGATGSATTPVSIYLYELVLFSMGARVNTTAYTPTAPLALVGSSSSATRTTALGHNTVFSPGAAPSAQTASMVFPSNPWAAAIATFKIAGSSAYYTRGIAETSTVTSTLGRGAVTFRNAIAETSTTSDTMSRQSALLRGLAESSTLTDAAVRGTITFRASLAETSTAADDLVRSGLMIHRALAETVGVSEALDRFRAIMRALAESTTVHDSLVRYLHASVDRTGRIVVTMTERDLLTQAIAPQDTIDHTITPGVDA
jgi:hypothetical protein